MSYTRTQRRRCVEAKLRSSVLGDEQVSVLEWLLMVCARGGQFGSEPEISRVAVSSRVMKDARLRVL